MNGAFGNSNFGVISGNCSQQDFNNSTSSSSNNSTVNARFDTATTRAYITYKKTGVRPAGFETTLRNMLSTVAR